MLLRTLCARSPKTNVHLQVIKLKDIPKLKAFLRESFYRDEPLFRCLKVIEHEETIRKIDAHALNQIKCDNSVMATNDVGDIMGVCINKFKIKTQAGEFIDDPHYNKILDLYLKIERDLKFFEKFKNVNSFMLFDTLSVGEKYRHRGISELLLIASIDLANKFGAKVVRMDCTNAYGAKAVQKLGFSKLHSVKYAEHKDWGGRLVFDIGAPHTELAIYAKRLRC